MNREQFISALKEVQLKVGAKWRKSPTIRTMGKIEGNHNFFCPVTYLCYYKTGQYFSSPNFKMAAGFMDLEDEVLDEILSFADYQNPNKELETILGLE